MTEGSISGCRVRGRHLILCHTLAPESSKTSISSPEPVQDNQMVIIVAVTSLLLFLFVTSILLCGIIGKHQCRRETGFYGVLAAWQRLPQAFRGQPA